MIKTEKKINELVAEDYVLGYVLHYFGIPFYKYTEETLQAVCRQKGLNMHQVVQELESIRKPSLSQAQLQAYPIEIIIQYLRHAHYRFINQKLPYMARLVEDLSDRCQCQPCLVHDLKILFPLFVEDFIHHIHEEEDTLFKYVLLLHQASKGHYSPGELHYQMQQNSLSRFALEHHDHDDEMRGIREFTRNYYLEPGADLHLQVLFAELQALEDDLKIHAQVEDEILLLKAMRLEQEVREMLRQKAQYN
ncbi:MAG: iron-sulfur cluster repair di-iron protein [Microscillaceae bacterium]|nr:iron-sulfur cluster repair di-iron protein [Microscillaceae bacterium]